MKRRTDNLSPHILAETLSSTALRSDMTSLERQALLQAAEGEQKRATKRAQPILELPATATLSEMRKARRSRAVRRGKDVFLPTWQDLCTAMPNALIRSALWSVKANRHERDHDDSLVDGDSDQTIVPSLGDAVLKRWKIGQPLTVCLGTQNLHDRASHEAAGWLASV